VKILADGKTDRVLGVHIVGVDAGNIIAEAALAMEFSASVKDIVRTCPPDPAGDRERSGARRRVAAGVTRDAAHAGRTSRAP
jgi:pyruvate/2-oxoglutarate dehydrogenase complex dihydrolipoamide dehydrogenase (E3) component